GAVISGALMSILGKYKWIAIAGVIITLLGLGLMLRLNTHSTGTDIEIALLVMGTGVGSGMAIYTTATQNALPHNIGQATAAINFFRQIGGAIGLAAMGSIMSAAYLPAFHNALPQTLQRSLPPGVLGVFENPGNLLGGGALAHLQASLVAQGPQGIALFNQLREAMRVGLAQGIHNVFLVSLGIMLATLLIVVFLQELPLRTRKSESKHDATSETPDLAKIVVS
ncbi:MAG TPA: MFS transporter, partial [Ktedonobacteraceae bacterium]|nr:MFS transporter [Ktedonobacteraceae bacterium]